MKALVYELSPARWVVCKLAGWVSRRAYATGLVPLRLADVPMPELPGPDWVRLRTNLAGICGTDLALIAQRNHPGSYLGAFASFPAVLGHENVATIESVGAEAGDWEPGQRVCVESAYGCAARGVDPPCAKCAVGLTSLCEHPGDDQLPPRALLGLNATYNGTWASHFVAHRSQLHAVPDEVPDEVAVLTDPLASAAHAVLRRPPQSGETVLVQGGGIIALGIIAAIRALGCDNAVTAVVRHGFQAELARRFGATDVLQFGRKASMPERFAAMGRHLGERPIAARFGNRVLLGGFDLTYDCSGTGIGLSDAAKWTRSRGTLVAAGTSGITIADTTSLWFKELHVVGANGRQIESVDTSSGWHGRPARGQRRHSYDVVFEWLSSGRMDWSGVPIARYALRDYRTAIAHLLGRSRHPIIKAVFDPRA